ncbi:family 2 encapsulin nanocompartment cargo protein terpene cyclase [Nocardia pseudobrasiliensis]|uniref:2-methylisoborneol synthase n=1 Tax=Nocardia pseudobrasiliensis TaxID=45979 RepID=A0A370I870_9NOCA|nr:family 2 encapsulin nanocompartment cargo protein terpene cyclase [Nocardia pseudobrasiliensis]RDI66909.1 2-methylisoborneol synthase [Nocardia pseudobrasiliensis]
MTNATEHPSNSTERVATLSGPKGLGTSSLSLPRPSAPTPAARSARDGCDDSRAFAPIIRLGRAEAPCVEREWGDGSAPPLYCPPPSRIDDALATEVDDRLVTWALGLGLDEDDAELLRSIGYGRLVMLTHTDCDDPDRLLLAAQLNTAWWMADDLFADDTARGARAEELGPRLSLVMAAMDPLPEMGEFSPPLNDALRDHLVFRAFESAVAHLNRHATPDQVQRACYATAAMFVSWNAYSAWRLPEREVPAWEYLAGRQHDSFYTSMTLIDPVAGYRLPGEIFYRTRVRHAAFRAGTAAVLVNDLLSVAKDAADENPVCNMVLQVAAERGCSVSRATEIVVDLHNRVVRDFEAERLAMRTEGSPELQLYLHGLRSWFAGSFEWHNTNPRYR